MLKKGDWGVIILSVLLGLFILFIVPSFKGTPDTVHIFKDGREIQTAPLSKDTVIIIKEGDEANKIEIKNGQVKMLEASCPDKLCINHHPISHAKESIICLPNQVAVELRGAKDSTLDGVSG